MNQRLTCRQLLVLAGLGVTFWALATLQIRLLPPSFNSSSWSGVLQFIASFPAGWLSVWITRRCAALSRQQLPPGILLAGGVAMMIDGAVLNWAPQVYAPLEVTARLGAAWLLWGYGAAYAITFFISRPRADASAVTVEQ